MLEWLLIWNPLIAVWVAWVVVAVLAAIRVSQFARAVARPAREGFDQFSPPAVVIVPFKGRDDDLPRHVNALLSQNYPDYRLVFVFESDHDPARPAIEHELTQHPAGETVDLVTAGPAPDDTGQKVHNQLAALEHLGTPQPPDTVLVFADSDAVPGPGWLGKLVGPHVQADRIGVTTGYRWLIPELRAQRPRPASAFASVINSGVASFIGHEDLTQAWGGSMALRAEFAHAQQLKDHLRGALSDDYQVTRLCRAADKRVYFVPDCLVASPVHFSWSQLFEFGRRQYLITRLHDPVLYRKALALVAGYVVANLSAIGVLLFALFTGRWVLLGLAAGALIAVGITNQVRAAYRRQAVATAFGRDMLRYLRHTLWLDRYATLPVMAVNLTLLLSAAVGETLTWRGHRYRLQGPQQVQRL
jgi:cellulose synthase/poly-beta-1,6-N-acetylglucosamine synthase-like glycosyltransferase